MILSANQPYFAPFSGFFYIDEKLFRDAGIELTSFTSRPPIYPQLWGDFIFNLSVFDLVLNCGPKAHDILVNS